MTEATAAEAAPSPERKSRRDHGWTAAGVVVLAIVWILAIVHVWRLAKEVQYKTFPCDFCSYYSSDLALRSGVDPYTADLPAIERKLGTYSQVAHGTEPPTQLLLFEPFTYFSLGAGFWVWIALNALALAGSLGLLLGGPRSGLSYQAAWILVALAILYTPVYNHFITSQNKLFTLLILALMMRCMEDRYDGTAGLLLALAGLTRIFPFVLVGYLLIRRRWRVILYSAAGTLLFGAITVAFIGAANSLSFIHSIGTSARYWDSDYNTSPVTLVSRVFWHSGYSGPAFNLMRTAAVVIVVVLVLIITTLVTVRKPIAEDHDWRAFSLWLITAVMLFPSSKRYYLVMLLIPFAALAVAAAHRRASRRAIAMAVVSYLLIRYPGGQARLLGLVGSHIAGVRSVLWSAAFPLLAAYISSYWLVTDETRDLNGSAQFESRSR